MRLETTPSHALYSARRAGYSRDPKHRSTWPSPSPGRSSASLTADTSPAGNSGPASWRQVWEPGRVRRASHWTRGPVFELSVQSHDKGIRPGREDTEAASCITQNNQHETEAASPALLQLPFLLTWLICIICINCSELSSGTEGK